MLLELHSASTSPELTVGVFLEEHCFHSECSVAQEFFDLDGHLICLFLHFKIRREPADLSWLQKKETESLGPGVGGATFESGMQKR